MPFFRRGRFDQLDEPTSPFNIEPGFAPDPVACLAIGCPSVLPIAIERREPPAAFGNAQGGARFSATTGRLDWSVSAYRGFEPFGFGALGAIPPQAGCRSGRHRVSPLHDDRRRFRDRPRPVGPARRGRGVRGRQLPAAGRRRLSSGSSFDAGIGLDRKAGDYRISGSVLAHRESYDEPIRGRTAAASAHGRLADPVGRSQLRRGALSGPDLRRLQRDRELGVPARHRDREAPRQRLARGIGRLVRRRREEP